MILTNRLPSCQWWDNSFTVQDWSWQWWWWGCTITCWKIQIATGCTVACSDLMTHEGFLQVLGSAIFPLLIILTIPEKESHYLFCKGNTCRHKSECFKSYTFCVNAVSCPTQRNKDSIFCLSSSSSPGSGTVTDCTAVSKTARIRELLIFLKVKSESKN